MGRFRRLRNVIILLIVLFALDMALLTLMIPVRTFLTWAVIVTQAIVAVYFSALSFGLLKALKDKSIDSND